MYTSDHGENRGHKGIWGKVVFLENSARIPLLLKTPGMSSATTNDQNVSLVDVFATLAEFAGVDVPYEISGRSLLPLLRGERREPNDAFSQYHGLYSEHSSFMLRADEFKLNVYNGDYPSELYSIVEDPRETANLSALPEYSEQMERMRRRMLEILGADFEAVESMIRTNQSKRRFIADSVAASEIVKARLRDQIRRFREARNDPWWDGGQYMARYETQLK